jgi:non-homologous end joining protein Ku
LVEAAVEKKTAASELSAAPEAPSGSKEGVKTKDGKVIDLVELLSQSLSKTEPKGGLKKAAANEVAPAPAAEAAPGPGPKKAKSKDSKKQATG